MLSLLNRRFAAWSKGYAPGEALYIHPSRVVRLIGHEYPDMQTSPDAWGDSVLQPVADAPAFEPLNSMPPDR